MAVGDTLGPWHYLPKQVTVDAFLPRFRQVLQSQSNNLEAALSRGYEGLVVPTGAQMCLVAKLASDWANDPFALRSIRGALREPDYIGQPMTIRGEVVQLRAQGGEGLADIEGGVFGAGHQSVRAHVQVALG